MVLTRRMRRVAENHSATAAATAADDLSEELVARILEQVPQQQRLSACALVCRSWSAAAADSTRKIKFKANSDAERTAGLSRWLQRHSSSRLMSLEVEGPPPLPATVFNALKGLVQLQDLTITHWYMPESTGPGPATITLHTLPDLPGLTRLRLQNYAQPGDVVELPQQSLLLPRLQVLVLEGVCFNPRILRGLTQLQELISDLFITPTADLWLATADAATTPIEALLAGVGHLTQLSTLWLCLYWEETDPVTVPSQAFAALTASSQLQYLFVELNSMTDLDPDLDDYAVMPGRDVLKHMFPTGRQLPQLEDLHIGTSYNWYGNWRVPPTDLLRIASSCPRLESFTFNHLLDPDAVSNLSPLLSFTSCSELGLGGQGIGNTAAPIVAQLTQLTKLSWAFCVGDDLDGMALAELLKLTQLQALELSRSHWHDVFGQDWSREESDALFAEEQQGRRYHCELTSREAVRSHLLAAAGEPLGDGSSGSRSSGSDLSSGGGSSDSDDSSSDSDDSSSGSGGASTCSSGGSDGGDTA